MDERRPTAAENCTAQYDGDELRPADPDALIPWDEARDRLAAQHTYWCATARPDGQPHVRPVLAVWLDGLLCSTTGPATRKGRNLAADPRCAFTATTDGLDLVVEGLAAPIDDPAFLERIAEAYRAKYGWPATVSGDALTAPYGAPSAGPPPYRPYAVVPAVVFGLGTDERFAPRSTRWRFA